MFGVNGPDSDGKRKSRETDDWRADTMTDYLAYQTKDIPDSLFRVSVQPSVSDSAQTPPSPVLYSKPRLSRSTTHSTHPSKSHRSNRRSDSHRSSSTVPTPQFKRDRERQLANIPRDTLLQHTISKEYELREAKHLLTTALIQLEAIREKFVHERDNRLSLEDEKKEQAVNTTRALIDTQQDAMDAKEEVRRFQLQLENSQTELHKVRDAVHQLESDKTDLERQLVRARDAARSFKEQNALLHAREDGRREGFEEGLRQGRAMHGIIDLTQAPHLPPAEDPNTKENPTSSRHKSNDRHSHSIDAEIELRKIAEKDRYRLNLQVTQLSRELDQQRQKTKEVEADKKRLAEETGRLKGQLRSKDEEIVRLTEKGAAHAKELQASERKGRESIARREAQADELKAKVDKLLTDNGVLQKEKEAMERQMKDQVERERERREKDKGTIVASSRTSMEPRIAYIPMPPPPIPPNIPTFGPIPRAPSSGSGSVRQQPRRRLSQSSTGSAPAQSPPGSGSRLSTIPENNDAGGNPTPHAVIPPWNPPFPQPTIPRIIQPPQSQSPRLMPQGPPNAQFLQPTGNFLYGLPEGRLANSSQSSIQINIEPPSRPPSGIDHHQVEPSGVFLTPNHQPVPLPSTQDNPLPILPRTRPSPNSTSTPTLHDYDTPGMATQPNSPVIPGVTVPMPQMPPRGIPGNGSTPVIDGPLPPGFVPQTIIDSNGVSTPIWQTGTLPTGPGPSVGGPPQTSRSGRIYGNPLNQDREDEDEPYVPFLGNGSVPSITPAANAGPRPASIYAPGPPLVPPMGNSWGYSPGPVIPGPLPHSAPSPEDDENEDIDSETAHNTRINAALGMRRPSQDFGRGPGGPGYPNWR